MGCADRVPVPAAAAALHAATPVTDLHAHPSLKTSLFRLRFDRCHRPGSAFDPLSLRCDLPKLVAGGVRVLASAVYVPERGLLDDCPLLRAAVLIAPPVRRLILGDPCSGALQVLDDFERVVAATGPVDGVQATVVRSADELHTALGEGRLAIVHTLEGAHHLAGDAGNVRRFRDRGVVMLTLAHFYPNDVAPPVDGIPSSMKPPGCFMRPKDLTAGLTPLGHDVLDEMRAVGMLADLTHCTPAARRDALDHLGTGQPVLMSHVGAATRHPDPMNPTAAEVRRIADTGGVIGVIAMGHWLGGDGGRGGHGGHGGDDGIAAMVETIRILANEGGMDAVAIGTDFDGFTDPPDDLPTPAHLPKLTAALLAAGFGDEDVRKVMGGNAVRVLLGG